MPADYPEQQNGARDAESVSFQSGAIEREENSSISPPCRSAQAVGRPVGNDMILLNMDQGSNGVVSVGHVGKLDTVTIDAARREQAMYERRVNKLGPALASGTVWNILLDLLISESSARTLSVIAVCIGSRAPSATAIRYLSLLEIDGLVERERDVTDRRRTFIRLTNRGRRFVFDLLQPL